MGPRVRTATLSGFAGLATSLGLDPAAVLADEGLDIADLDAPDRWVPAPAVARLLETCAQQSGCEDFGLRLAELRGLGTLGPLSVALRDQPDLQHALQLLTRYEHAYNEALHLRLTQDEGQATIAVWLEFGEPAPLDQARDLVMAALIGIIRALIGDWVPRSAHFARSAPVDPTTFHRVFGPRIVFGDEFTGLLLPARELEMPVLIADPTVRREVIGIEAGGAGHG